MREEQVRKLFGARIKALRQEQNLNGTDLAELMDPPRHRTWISQLERGANASLETVSRIAEVLGVDEMDLFTHPSEGGLRHEINDLTRQAPWEVLVEIRDQLKRGIAESTEKKKAREERLLARGAGHRKP